MSLEATEGRPMRTLETPRLVLRPVAHPDAAPIGALLAHPRVFRFLCDGAPAGPAVVHELIAASATLFEDLGLGHFLATSRADGSIVGLTGFRRAEIGGIELVCALWPHLWGQGLAGEACRACLELAFRDAGLREVLAAADAPNAASLRLIERLGFRHVADTFGAFGAIHWFARRSDRGGSDLRPRPLRAE